MAISSKNAPLNTQGSRGIPHSDTTPRESAPAVDTAVPHSSTNGARKKRKKKKGKSISVKNEDDHDLELEGEEYAYSDMPVGGMDGFEALDGIMNELKELEPSLTEAFANARNRTSLSPDLESVHLSTTKALNSLGQSNPTIRGTSNGMDSKSLPSSATDQAEMLAELYRNVELSASAASLSNRKMTDRQRLEEVRESMNSLSGTMRTFVQTALSQMADLGLNDSELKQRSIQHIAKDMLENGMGMGVSVGVGIGRGPGTGPNSNGSGRGVDRHSVDDIDLDTLPEAALTQALERLAAGKSTLSSQGIQGEVVVSHEFDGEVFSDEEEGYEEKVDWKLSMTLASRVRPELERKQASQREENGFPKEEREPSEKSSKKSQKNRKRVTKGDIVTVEGHGRESVTREAAQGDPAIAIDDDAAQMPAMPKQPPPPSSRAMGKQPMTYPPPQSTATTHSTPAPPRSARAAAKAPANPQSYQHNHAHHHPSPPASTAPSQQKLRPPAGGTQSKANTNSKLWSTNSTEERERIKEFWLGLSIEERRALVKIEKDAVLKRMKEQQKHSCTCAVCGRKRNAIEEELEVLYDAYYDELEQYANYQQRYVNSGGTIPPPPGPGPFPGSVELDKNGVVVGPGGKAIAAHPHGHPNGRQKALPNGPGKKQVAPPAPPESEFDEEDPDDGEYEEDDYEDEEDEEEDEEEDVDVEDDVDIRNRTGHRNAQARDRARTGANDKANGRDDLFNGANLTVTGPGNILTVADDLLKNDGKKFLEMMEQLAERRMQRELFAEGDVEDSEDEDDEDADEEEDGDEDDEDEDDDEDLMTEEQKIEEGKRMFSIFAARMFESRVLDAYREKVAQERQKELLRELEEEDSLAKQKEAKKAKENQRKKDKKKAQKQMKEEERAAKAAEKIAEETAAREAQERREQEQRARREAEKLKREASRKAAEEERLRKEEERRKRQEAEREAQAEKEKRRKEKEDKVRAERKEREERERRAKEERDAKAAIEKAKREEKEREERERKEREKKEREEREAKEKEKEKETKEKEAREKEKAAKAAAAASQAKARAPSPRANAAPSGSSRQAQQVTPKKIFTKANGSVQNSPTGTGVSNRQPRPIVPITASASAPQIASPPPKAAPAISASPTTANAFSPSLPTAGQNGLSNQQQQQGQQGQGQAQQAAMSPRAAPFPPAPGLSPFGSYIPQLPTSLGPSPIARGHGFGSGPPFGVSDPPFGRGLGLSPAAPIGPPGQKMQTGNVTSPVIAPGSAAIGASGSSGVIQPPSRRMSSAIDPGPITRPIAPIGHIAPIGRPLTNGDVSQSHSSSAVGTSTSSSNNSGNVSPIRRSPSPKGVLGSSALAADDDEVVPTTAPSRRSTTHPIASLAPLGGSSWHSPRNSINVSVSNSMVGGIGAVGVPPSPWGATPPSHSQGFSPSRAAGAPNTASGVGLGMGAGGLWGQPFTVGSAPSGTPAPGGMVGGSGGVLGDWHPHAPPGSQFFGGGPPFGMHPNHNTVTPPPHASGN